VKNNRRAIFRLILKPKAFKFHQAFFSMKKFCSRNLCTKLLFPNRDRAKFAKSCDFEFMHRIKKLFLTLLTLKAKVSSLKYSFGN